MKEPSAAYTCDGADPVPVLPPSPKFHENDNASPSGSVDAAPLNAIADPASPWYGPPTSADGAWFTVVCPATASSYACCAESWPSLTRIVTVTGPACEDAGV